MKAEETLGDLLNEFRDLKRLYCFEGDSGLQKFEKILEAIGYTGHGYRFGSPIEAFLSDNSGAVDALLDWIVEQNCPEWRESVEAELPEKDGDEEDEDDA